jgi:hypoxanthine phosphoribosyltransferase
MKIIHRSLSALLTEVKERGKVDGVRVAALMQSTFEGAGMPRYTSWVIVSAPLDSWEKWAEWRLVVARQRAEVTERGFRVPERLAARTEEKLAEVRGWIEVAGLVMRDGILAADAETLGGVLG